MGIRQSIINLLTPAVKEIINNSYESDLIEKKSIAINEGGFNVLQGKEDSWWTYLAPSIAYRLYAISDVILAACNKICWAYAQIDPVLKHKKTGEIILDHPALELEKNSDMRLRKIQLRFEKMLSLLLTGECFPVLVGNVKYEPVGMFHYPACDVNVVQNPDGYINNIICTYVSVTKSFQRSISKNYNNYVFNTEDGLNQVVHILYNRKRGMTRAQSPLESVYNQVLSKIFGHSHNKNMLQNASRPGGLWSPEQIGMTQQQYEAFKQEVRGFTGYLNSGREVVANHPIKYQNFLLNTREMDFKELLDRCKEDIYDAFDIPLPLANTQTMTMDNYKSAIGAFFDFAVLPKAKFLIGEDFAYALHRFKDGNQFEACVDERQIPAIKDRLFARGKDMTAMESYTEDEKRAATGYEALADGTGNVIYRSAGKVPYSGEDDFFNDEIRYAGTLKKPVNAEDNADIVEKE